MADFSIHHVLRWCPFTLLFVLLAVECVVFETSASRARNKSLAKKGVRRPYAKKPSAAAVRPSNKRLRPSRNRPKRGDKNKRPAAKGRTAPLPPFKETWNFFKVGDDEYIYDYYYWNMDSVGVSVLTNDPMR